ncbi:hypothetical protein ABES80_18890 [Bacillus gobiensis]|uniref:SRPBCC family protein n=1 Tax=Bacillus gobiensis TaxID=1441095 RepID=UPI003D257AFD
MDISFNHDIFIDRSANHVYEYLRKMKNYSLWNYAVLSVEPIEDSAERNTYQLKRNLGESIEIETIKILEFRLNQLLHFQATGGRFSYEMKYNLNSVGNRTLLNNSVKMKPTGISIWFLKLFKNTIQTEVKNNLTVLKTIIE